MNVVKALVEANANINTKLFFGITALISGIKTLIYPSIFNLLLKNFFQTAIYLNHTSIARYLINAGADMNVQDNYGITPLSWGIIFSISIVSSIFQSLFFSKHA